ncbi:MAG: gamma-glutamylcyclotransferase family protein [Myxococcota bacterium]|nr:gamma-glutamylcyclotransferase family protein [Myxococcota bacterium]
MQSLYFAYGSNLSTPRLRGRVESAVVVGPAVLRGRRLTTDKRGRDGSGKANLVPDRVGEVWGVVYAIRDEHWPALDACEAGYERLRVGVHTERERVLAWTYVSQKLAEDPVPFSWYKRLIVEGAREHGLPGPWLRFLESLPEKPGE